MDQHMHDPKKYGPNTVWAQYHRVSAGMRHDLYSAWAADRARRHDTVNGPTRGGSIILDCWIDL